MVRGLACPIHARCRRSGLGELRIPDERATWRIVYRLDPDAVVIVEVFGKQTAATPRRIIEVCQRRLRAYDRAIQEG